MKLIYKHDTATGKTVLEAGGTALSFAQEKPTGVINGVNTSFTLVNTPAYNSTVVLWLDAIPLEQGVDYTILNNTITMGTPPANGQRLYAFYGY